MVPQGPGADSRPPGEFPDAHPVPFPGAAETTDEDPGRVALVQQVTLAYLRHVTGVDHGVWRTARSVLADGHPLGRPESK